MDRISGRLGQRPDGFAITASKTVHANPAWGDKNRWDGLCRGVRQNEEGQGDPDENRPASTNSSRLDLLDFLLAWLPDRPQYFIRQARRDVDNPLTSSDDHAKQR